MDSVNDELRHESFISHLVSSGGVMIFSFLMGSNDGDTRAHATAAIMTAKNMAYGDSNQCVEGGLWDFDRGGGHHSRC